MSKMRGPAIFLAQSLDASKCLHANVWISRKKPLGLIACIY